MFEQVYVGIDLGGTTIKVGICDAKGNLLHTSEGPTEIFKGLDIVVNNIETYVRQIVEQSPYDWSQVVGIGAGIPGFINIKEGVILFTPNVRFKDIPIRSILEERFDKPVKIDNDANVAALGEAWSGAAKGIDNCVCYTLGTGIGGGIIISGTIIRGFTGLAGELGHVAVVPDLEAIQCGCGKIGCLETVSSATGIIRMANDAVERGDHTSLSLVGRIMAKDVLDAAKAGDEVAIRIISRAAYYLGKAMAAVAVMLNPERFIIGGGVSKAGEFLIEQIQETFMKLTPDPVAHGVSIIPAELGNDAGIIGAAYLFLHS